MIIEYHRPETIEEALALLSRPAPLTLPLGGGTVLNAPSDDDFAVVDLQKLGLDKITKKGSALHIGAAATLQALLEYKDIPEALGKAIRHEAGYNIRQSGTAAGSLVAADGRSPFAAVMLALDCKLSWMPEDSENLGEFLPMRGKRVPGRLITAVSIPTNVDLAYEYVARSPADLPIVCAAAARWSSGRARLVLGGYGDAPLMAVDGNDANDILPAVENAYSTAADQWASAEYRADTAKVLAQRCLDQINS
ncbi:MAG: FAD binding domain-containing protein [Anaerolineae bacterium]|nr:FAD binding domain-containing protein [Anaerolineae bacterium]